jgi:hypothetical protein
MKAIEWFDELAKKVLKELPGVEEFRPDPKTMSLALGSRVAIVFDTGANALVAQSFTAGGTLASRLQERVQHIDPLSYDIFEATVESAASAIIAHLRA